VRIKEFLLEDRQLLVVEVELELQRVIRHPATPLEKSHDLVEDVIQVHPFPSLPEDSKQCDPDSTDVVGNRQRYTFTG
jgi:hypothetical protein